MWQFFWLLNTRDLTFSSGNFLYALSRRVYQLNEQRLHTNWQRKVFTKLLGLQYKVVYKKGAKNSVVDALSRMPSECPESEQCLIVSSGQPKWIEEVTSTYAADPFTQDIIAKLVLDGIVVHNFTWVNGILCYKSRIWVGADSSTHHRLICALHDSTLGGHSSISITYRRLKQIFAWKGMKTEAHDFVKSCMIYQ
jgi:hypothetical protein